MAYRNQRKTVYKLFDNNSTKQVLYVNVVEYANGRFQLITEKYFDNLQLIIEYDVTYAKHQIICNHIGCSPCKMFLLAALVYSTIFPLYLSYTYIVDYNVSSNPSKTYPVWEGAIVRIKSERTSFSWIYNNTILTNRSITDLSKHDVYNNSGLPTSKVNATNRLLILDDIDMTFNGLYYGSLSVSYLNLILISIRIVRFDIFVQKDIYGICRGYIRLVDHISPNGYEIVRRLDSYDLDISQHPVSNSDYEITNSRIQVNQNQWQITQINVTHTAENIVGFKQTTISKQIGIFVACF
ncbi:unnamed protein product [Didymodactylos carnosus]|uniref:Uncharacterized protein n=1 Tax=Didymodactylos carnosus TaxID=1234261 RepID=A0A815PLW4_9BILA|nr:unnamed protein product [Didymodactylos carnosus]CAF4324560.1 unnamed protein product [Didymodactylos carnosus]